MNTNQPFCWGNSSFIAIGIPRPMAISAEFIELSAGDHHLCGLQKPLMGKRRNHSLVDCWGYNMTRSHVFEGQIQSISAGCAFNCGLFSQNRSAFCWGDEISSGVISQYPKYARISKIFCRCWESEEQIAVALFRQGQVNVDLAPHDPMLSVVGVAVNHGEIALNGFIGNLISLTANFYYVRLQGSEGLLDFSPYDELEKSHWEGLPEDSQVGKGSFSCVFKGVLKDGVAVAVKRAILSPDMKKNSMEFHNELDLLSRLNHAHLLNLLGYCEEGEQRLLVYEYMANGSLHQHLHGNPKTLKSQLNWVKRVTIAVQAARGIEYLHGYACPPVNPIRDIKSQNILNDEEHNGTEFRFRELHYWDQQTAARR
ncbi:serine/threonine-protein kinase-like protein ACR4 [Tanacetum coccineum]